MKNQKINIKIDTVNVTFNFSGTINYGGFPFVPPVDKKSENKPSFSDEGKGKTRYIPSSQPNNVQDLLNENRDLKNQISIAKSGYKAAHKTAKNLQEGLSETCKIRANLEEELKRKNKIIDSLEKESKEFRDLNSRQKAKVKAVNEILQAYKKLVENMEDKMNRIEQEIENMLYK